MEMGVAPCGVCDRVGLSNRMEFMIKMAMTPRGICDKDDSNTAWDL